MSARDPRRPGLDRMRRDGWLAAHKWLLLRRLAQAGFLALFLTGPLWGWWITKGTLAASITFDVLPLTDPLMAVQALLAGHVLEVSGLVGAALVIVAYALIGGRAFCGWVCPVNVITDFAAWLRTRLGLKEAYPLDRRLRLAILAGLLVGSAVTGTIVWEFVNPVTMLHRGLVYGSLFSAGAALWISAAILLLDVGVASRAWCGHLCPVGAFYALIGAKGLVRVSAVNRDACDNCMDCFTVCPERQVITPALRGAKNKVGPLILSRDCSNCGRCIDVCAKDVFIFTTRFHDGAGMAAQSPRDGVLQGEKML